ncbi:ROK family transcriptional regulator [Phyllobacterium sp. SB3]|uniref:ROK family transcriptional regulator n=1 Tax=Phyllobacterium sp. SB3 TaxID=3156073 RepID=UPI0032AF7BFD
MADQTLAKFVNERKILTMLRIRGGASRADIARNLSVTPATITRLINSLSDRGLVHDVKLSPFENTVSREPGRPGVSVALNAKGAYFLGVEIGIGILRFALIDLSAGIAASSELHVSKNISPINAAEAIGEHLAVLERDIRYGGKIYSIGVTVPGVVTSEGFVINLPILGWKAVDLLAILSKVITLPCYVENNANAAAFGSVYTQPALPSVCTIFLKLGKGCGGAAIINGRLLRGANGTAGEFGHIRISGEGAKCSCGQTGCLETWVNLSALARAYTGHDDLSESQYAALPGDIVAAAERGDKKAMAAVASFAHWMALGIVTLVNQFNPTTVMLGGTMRPVIQSCLAQIQEAVGAGIIPGVPPPQVRLSELGIFECAVGAATIAHHHAFDISRLDLADVELTP